MTIKFHIFLQLHAHEFNTNVALYELYSYAVKYNDQVRIILLYYLFEYKCHINTISWSFNEPDTVACNSFGTLALHFYEYIIFPPIISLENFLYCDILKGHNHSFQRLCNLFLIVSFWRCQFDIFLINQSFINNFILMKNMYQSLLLFLKKRKKSFYNTYCLSQMTINWTKMQFQTFLDIHEGTKP